MENVLKKSYLQFTLRATINGLSLESRKLRLKANKYKSADTRSAMNSYRWMTSDKIRMHLLAYAFLRGKTYASVEKSCAEDNKVNPDLLYKVISDFAPNFIAYDAYTKTGGKSFKVSLEEVKAWLEGADTNA